MTIFESLLPLIRATVAVICLAFLGCAELNKLNQMTADSSKKQALLDERLAKYHKAVYWGTSNEIQQYVQPESASKLMNQLKSSRKVDRLVDLEVSNIEYDDEFNNAQVEVTVRYFQNTSFTVNVRKELEYWSYNRFSGGWLISDYQVLEAGQVENSNPKLGKKSDVSLGS